MNVEALQTDQQRKTPISNGPKTAPFFFRFGQDRSRDSQKSDQPGQDCISVRWTATRLAATLCDGVSQSFFGELAAAELSNKLSQFLLALPNESDPNLLHDTIRDYLDTLSSTFSQTVEGYSLEHVEPAFLRTVLEKKRYLGSEAVFSAVLLDKRTDRVLFVWAGDCRLRLWLRGEEVTRELLSTETFITQERWSSSKGVIGNLHLALYPFSSFDTIISYSDGLALIDEKPNIFQENNVAIEHYISQTKSLASSDDVSFLQISTLPADTIQENLVAQLPELRVMEQAASDYVQFQWQNLPQVLSWEVVADSETGFAKLEASKNIVKVPKAEIPSEGAWLAYRGKTSDGFSPWSSWKFYQPPRTSKNDETGISGQNALLPPTQSPQTGYVPLPVTNNTYPAGSGTPHMPSYNGSTDRYSHKGPIQTLSGGTLSDRRWQYALLALLIGVVVMGYFLIFGDKEEDMEFTQPNPQTPFILNTPISNSRTVDTVTVTEIPATDDADVNEVPETSTPLITGNSDIPEILLDNNEIEKPVVFSLEETAISRLIFIRRETCFSLK